MQKLICLLCKSYLLLYDFFFVFFLGVRRVTRHAKHVAVRIVRNVYLVISVDIGTKVDVLKNVRHIIMPIRNSTNAWNVHPVVRNVIVPLVYPV